MKQKSCKERVRPALQQAIKDLRRLYEAYSQGKEEVEDLGSLWDYGLCFDYVPVGTFKGKNQGYFRYQLSWGGPSDEFRFFVDPDLSVYKIQYWFLDWFDGASIELQGEDFQLLKDIFELFKDMGVAEKALQEAKA